jgi:hypothetical protein
MRDEIRQARETLYIVTKLVNPGPMLSSDGQMDASEYYTHPGDKTLIAANTYHVV